MEYKTYPQRWILLGVLCCVSFSQLYSMGGFIVLNNVVSQFYRVSPFQTDLLAIIGALLASPICFATAYFSDKLALRSLMLLTTGSMFCGSVICCIGFLSRTLFYVTVFGRVLMLSSVGIMYTTQVILAATWFPTFQTATALTLQLCSLMIGQVSASLVYPHVIPSMRFANATNKTETIQTSRVVKLFASTFTSLAIALFICLVLTLIFCKDHPPTPPSSAQEKLLLKRAHLKKREVPNVSKFREICTVATKRPFILICCAEIFAASSLVFIQFLLPSFVLNVFPHLENTIPGTILVISVIFGAITMPITGRLVDKFKNFKTMTLSGSGLMVICIVGIVFAYSYKNLLSLYFLYCLCSIGRTMYRPPATELLLETTYPDNKLVAVSLLMTIINLAVFSFTLIIRAILTSAGAVVATAFTGFMLVLNIIFVAFVKPDYKRLNAGSDGYQPMNEE